MICPYNQVFSYNEQTNILNEENPEFIEKHINVNIWRNMTCYEEKCGAWRNGKCCYNSQNME